METKKKPEVNLDSKKPLFFNIGLVLALAVVITAFEYKSFDKPVNFPDFENKIFDIDEALPEIPNTYSQPAPPPPVMKAAPQSPDDIVEVKNDLPEMPPLLIHVDLPESKPAPANSDLIKEAAPSMEEPTEEPTVIFAEEMPKLGENNAKFYEYLAKNIKYPSTAKQMQIEGKVYVQFVIDKDGAVTEVEVLKGIGGGCDEEAIRVLKNSPKWQPGKQRGNPVRVRMTMPITFSLSK